MRGFFYRFSQFSAVLLILLYSCNKDNTDDQQQLIDEAKLISYVTENYPPYNYEQNGEYFGVSIDILLALFENLNTGMNSGNIRMMGWTDAYQMTLDQSNTMLFSTVRTAERENLFKWLGPIAPHSEVLIALKENNVDINSEAELNNYNIGAIKNYSSIQDLLDLGVLTENIIQVDNTDQLYEQLGNGTADCIAYSEQGNQLILEALGLDIEDFEIVYTVRVSQLYYAFNINTSDDLIRFFRDGLETLINDKGADGSSVYEKILNRYSVIQEGNDNISEEMVINLVNTTANDVGSDTPGTLSKINQQLAPYKDPDNPSLYVFVYDTSVTLVAHGANELLIGKNLKGKPDAAGKLFRDEIIEGALNQGTGCVDYIYKKPDQSGLYLKTTYYKLVTGSDNQPYVVCSGKYK